MPTTFEIAGSSPKPCGECGDVYGHEPTCAAFDAGVQHGAAYAAAALIAGTPFPFGRDSSNPPRVREPEGCADCIYRDCTPESVGYGREYRCGFNPSRKPHCPSESGKPRPDDCPYTPTARSDHE